MSSVILAGVREQSTERRRDGRSSVMIRPSSLIQTAKGCCFGRPENQAGKNTRQIESRRRRLSVLCTRVAEQQEENECGWKMETNSVLESQITQAETTLRTSLSLFVSLIICFLIRLLNLPAHPECSHRSTTPSGQPVISGYDFHTQPCCSVSYPTSGFRWNHYFLLFT